MQCEAVVIAQISVPTPFQPGCCEDYVRGGLVEGDVENVASFSMSITNRPLAVFAACNRDICPQCGRQLLSFSPLKV